MAKVYKFEVYDDEDDTKVTVEFATDQDAWSGYNGPVYNFFNFLKGQGYVFGDNSMIGVMRADDEFVPAVDDL
jgi:hypothetical protein